MERPRYKSLTALKGLIIFIVALEHTVAFFPIKFPPVINFILIPYGKEYVNKFLFMISGFLISYGYRDKIAHGQIDLLRFMGKRLKKLYPLYIITNVFALLLSVLKDGVIASFTMLRGILIALMMNYGWFGTATPYNGPTWFICIVLQCYLIYFFVAKQYQSHKNFYWLLLLFIPAFGYYLQGQNIFFPFCFSANGEAYLTFFIGVILRECTYLFETRKEDFQKKVSRIIAAIYAVIIFILIIGEKIYSTRVFAGDIEFMNSVLICPLTVLLAVYFKPYEKLLTITPIYQLGRISMSIFMWHWPTLFAIWTVKNYYDNRIHISNGVCFWIYIVLLFAVSIISYNLFEKKGNIFEKFWKNGTEEQKYFEKAEDLK